MVPATRTSIEGDSNSMITATAYATSDPSDTTVVATVTLPDMADTKFHTLTNPGFWWTYTHKDCGCNLTATDCCNYERYECQTVKVLDSNGDVDVVACMEGFGCDDDPARHPMLRNARRLSATSKSFAVAAYAAAHNMPYYSISAE